MNHIEDNEQICLMEWAAAQSGKFPELSLIFHIPNGGKRNAREAARFKRMCEYGFTEGEDFNSLKIERVQTEGTREVRRTVTDHTLTIPMAKELCMLQRNDKGKMFRQYFIKVEEAWNSPEMVMKRALEFADRKVEELTSKIRRDAPKVLFADAVMACLSNSKRRAASCPTISAVGLKALRRAAMRFPCVTVMTKQGGIFYGTWNLKAQTAANPSNFAFKAAFEYR